MDTPIYPILMSTEKSQQLKHWDKFINLFAYYSL